MFKRLVAFMSGLFKSPIFRRSLTQFTVLAVVTGIFAYLTLNNDNNIARTSTLAVPPQYASLSNLTAVDLEQQLRNKASTVEGLILIKGTKSIVVLGKGFDRDSLVLQADIEVMQGLAKAAKLPVSTEDASTVRELPGFIISFWWIFAIALIYWFGRFLFKSRKNEDVPSRFMVGWNGYQAGLKYALTKSKMRRWRFYAVVSVVLALALTAIGLLRPFNDKDQVVLPSDFAAAARAQPYQVERHLKGHAEEFSRVAFAPAMNAAYVVINTPLPPPLKQPVGEQVVTVEGGEVLVPIPATTATAVRAGGFTSIARTVVFPKTPEGVKAYRAFVDAIRAGGIDNKEADRAVATDFWETITPLGRTLAITLGVLLLLSICVTVSASLDSDKDEDQNESNLVIAGPDGKPAPVGNTTVQSLKKFEDVAGCDEAIDACKLVVKKLRFPLIYKVFGAPVPKGVIFYGAPGCGKTLLARAMAGETGGGFIAVSGSQFVKMYVGVGANAVREKFQEARDLAKKTGKPTFLFIDEFDAIGKKRGQGEGGGDKEYEQTLNELLVQMDGFANDGKVIVIAATNRLDVLDEAVLRSGRFDIKIEIKKPDRKGRAEIFQVYLRNRKLTAAGASPREQLQTLQKVLNDCSTRSRDFSGADIELTVKEASTIAAERHYEEMKDLSEDEMKERAVLLPSDLQEAIDLVSYGRTLKSRTRSAEERKATAIHEIGHAAIPTLLNGDKVNRITIVMTDKSLGLMESGSDEDRYGWDKKEFLLRIKTMLAGRAAEERIGGSCSTGASNDFERASMLARQMVGMFGMSEEFGVRTIPLDRNALPVGQIGNTLMETFTTAWSRIVDECQKEVCQLIDDNRERIIRASDVLFEEEVLSGDRFREIWNAPLAEKSVETNAEGNA
jgi:cell division protease FtsH